MSMNSNVCDAAVGFPAGTLVLTGNGYVPIEEIYQGDIVLTHAGNWKPVTDVIVRNSRTVRLIGGHSGLVAAVEQRFYNTTEKYISQVKNLVSRWMPAIQMKSKLWGIPIVFQGIEAPMEIRDNPRLLFLVGKWLSDAGVVDDGFTDIVGLQSFLEEHFDNEKTLPGWALCLNEEQRNEILRGFLWSEGNLCSDTIPEGFTESKKTAYSIRLLCESLHFHCNCRYNMIRGKYHITASKRVYRLFSKAFCWRRCREIEPHSENETVYSLTVEDDHSYIVEGFTAHDGHDFAA